MCLSLYIYIYSCLLICLHSFIKSKEVVGLGLRVGGLPSLPVSSHKLVSTLCSSPKECHKIGRPYKWPDTTCSSPNVTCIKLRQITCFYVFSLSLSLLLLRLLSCNFFFLGFAMHLRFLVFLFIDSNTKKCQTKLLAFPKRKGKGNGLYYYARIVPEKVVFDCFVD